MSITITDSLSMRVRRLSPPLIVCGSFSPWPANPWRITWNCCPSILFTGYFGRMAISSIIPLTLSHWKTKFGRNLPETFRAISSFLTYSEKVFHEGYEKLVHVPFVNPWNMISVAPQLIRLRAFRSVYSMVSKYIHDPHLRQLFSFHSLLVGGNPFTTTSIYTLIHCLERKWGVFFPKGGTGALVRALVKLFLELGGEIRFNSEVTEIMTVQPGDRGHYKKRSERRL